MYTFKGALKFANKQTKPNPKPNQMNKNKTKHILRDLKTTHKTHKKFPAIINLRKQTQTMMRYHCTLRIAETQKSAPTEYIGTRI